MYNLLEYRDNYDKVSGSLWQYHKDDPSNIRESELNKFKKFKSRFKNNTNDAGIAKLKTVVPLKYLSNFWRAFEMPRINCEINPMLNWSPDIWG